MAVRSGDLTARPKLPHVVIVGAGFGGLEAARALARENVEITVIDARNHHCFQPLLYQVATAALSPADIAWPIRALLRGQKNVRVVLARVIGVDTKTQTVATDSLSFRYDYLVVATGATHSWFGHDDWAPYAPGLKHIDDATRIRGRILLAFERAELTTDARERARLLTFVVIGGGPTGVEMAGAIAEIARETLRNDFRDIDPGQSRIVLVEAAGRLLGGFPESLARYAERTLESMGVDVITSSAVTACDANGVTAGTTRIESATLIWAAGIVASPAAEWLGVPRDRNGRVLVNPDLSVSLPPPIARGNERERDGHANVFVIGDAASLQAGGTQLPGVATVAKQMGRHVARTIKSRVAGRPSPGPFRYRRLGELATIGRRTAIVNLPGLKLTGWLGWVFWSVVHIYFLIGARNRVIVAFSWLWSYLTFQRGARLILTDAEP